MWHKCVTLIFIVAIMIVKRAMAEVDVTAFNKGGVGVYIRNKDFVGAPSRMKEEPFNLIMKSQSLNVRKY